MQTPAQLKYNQADLWIRVDVDIATLGVSDYAQDHLSDVVFVEFKAEEGSKVKQGDLVAVVESVKASSDILAPLSGTITETNQALTASPELVNEDPYDRAWLIKIKISAPSELNELLDADAYQQYRAE